jgi:hypothetical protein
MQNRSTGQRLACELVAIEGGRYDVLVTSPANEVITPETFDSLARALEFSAHLAVELAHTGWTLQEDQNGSTFAFERH